MIVICFQSLYYYDMPTEYAKFHDERFQALDEAVLAAIGRASLDLGAASILEVGPSDWAAGDVFRGFGRQAVLGFDVSDPETHGGHLSADGFSALPTERHVADLNSCIDPNGIDPFDVIIFAETLEHLHRPAEFVLSGLKNLLTENGVIVLQTPNFACIANRIKLLLGKNPQDTLRDTDSNPGHIREYTPKELRKACDVAGLDVDACRMSNYFTSQLVRRAIKDMLPPSMHDGVTMTLSQIVEPSS